MDGVEIERSLPDSVFKTLFEFESCTDIEGISKIRVKVHGLQGSWCSIFNHTRRAWSDAWVWVDNIDLKIADHYVP
jgi:hypothetical protein